MYDSKKDKENRKRINIEENNRIKELYENATGKDKEYWEYLMLMENENHIPRID